MAVELPAKAEHIVQNAPDHFLETRGMTRADLRSFIEGRVVRDLEKSPKVGDKAPEITCEQLSSTGDRTGEMVSLSSLFGKPVGLIFGSYT